MNVPSFSISKTASELPTNHCSKHETDSWASEESPQNITTSSLHHSTIASINNMNHWPMPTWSQNPIGWICSPVYSLVYIRDNIIITHDPAVHIVVMIMIFTMIVTIATIVRSQKNRFTYEYSGLWHTLTNNHLLIIIVYYNNHWIMIISYIVHYNS